MSFILQNSMAFLPSLNTISSSTPFPITTIPFSATKSHSAKKLSFSYHFLTRPVRGSQKDPEPFGYKSSLLKDIEDKKGEMKKVLERMTLEQKPGDRMASHRETKVLFDEMKKLRYLLGKDDSKKSKRDGLIPKRDLVNWFEWLCKDEQYYTAALHQLWLNEKNEMEEDNIEDNLQYKYVINWKLTLIEYYKLKVSEYLCVA